MSLWNNVANTVGRTASNTVDVASTAVVDAAPPSPGEVIGIVDEEVVASGTAAFRDAVALFGDDNNWGEAVSLDTGIEPRDFAYGESKETIAEYKAGYINDADGALTEAAAKLRFFGHQDQEGMSGSTGVETEVGLHHRFDPGTVLGIRFRTQDAFVGLRGRAAAEAGCLGGRIGEELFIGASYSGKMGDGPEVDEAQPWWNGAYSADLGVGEAAIAEIDILSANVYAGVRAGLDLRAKGRRHDPIWNGFGVITKSDVNLFVGAIAEVDGSFDPRGLSGSVDAFAGARAGIQQGFSLAHDGSELIGGFLEAEGWVGAGVKADFTVGYDRNEERYHLSGDAGAALGYGGSVGGGVSIAGKDFGTMFDLGDDNEPPTP